MYCSEGSMTTNNSSKDKSIWETKAMRASLRAILSLAVHI